MTFIVYQSNRSLAEKKMTPVASLVNVHHLRPRGGLVGPVSA